MDVLQHNVMSYKQYREKLEGGISIIPVDFFKYHGWADVENMLATLKVWRQ